MNYWCKEYLEVFCIARSCTLDHFGESTLLMSQKILRSIKFQNLKSGTKYWIANNTWWWFSISKSAISKCFSVTNLVMVLQIGMLSSFSCWVFFMWHLSIFYMTLEHFLCGTWTFPNILVHCLCRNFDLPNVMSWTCGLDIPHVAHVVNLWTFENYFELLVNFVVELL